MDLQLKDKVIVVTGAAGIRGSIGQTIVAALAREQAIPVIICRNDRGIGYAEELQQMGLDAIFLKTDLSDHQQIEASMQQIAAKYGQLDGIVNNVGVNDGKGLNSSVDEFIRSLELNLISYFATVKYGLPLLKKSPGASILNIGSKVALTGQGGTSGYAASKGGILGLTREWAVDLLPHRIRVNALIIAESWTPAYQNWIDTLENGAEKLRRIKEQIPFEHRMTTPDEIANSVLFHLSDRASHTTGQFLYVDGGYVHLDRSLLVE